MYGWMSPALQRFHDHETQIQVSKSQVQLLILMSEYAHFFAPVPIGILADTFGRKPLFFFNTILAAIGWAETYFASKELECMIMFKKIIISSLYLLARFDTYFILSIST